MVHNICSPRARNLGHAAGIMLIPTFAENERVEEVKGERRDKLFTPKQQQAAQRYLDFPPEGNRTAQSLRDHLLSSF